MPSAIRPAEAPPPEDDAALVRRLAAAPELFAAIEQESGPELAVQARLRERFPADLVRRGLEVVLLRRLAAGKFTRADRMWFTRQGLEQATPEAVARHKAGRFADAAGEDPVWDVCCGVGGDALALTDVRSVVAFDADPAQLVRTELNVAVYGGAARLQTQLADATTLDLAGRLIHVDPDRRAHGRRTLRLDQCTPPLAWLQEASRRARGGALKLSPASNFGGKFPDAEVELVSLGGECKEATVWFGELRGASPWRATVLPAGSTLAGHPLDVATDVRPNGGWLFDPDPAVVRAGLVDLLARDAGVWRLDAAEEYLSAERPVESPFLTPFEVIDVLPNNPTAIRNAVRAQDWGEVEIKCRHVHVEVDAVRRRLPLEGTGRGVLFFARLDGRTHAVLARRPTRR